MIASTMNSELKTETERETVFHPKKFLVWMLIVASVMLFAAFTSAYIVRRGEGNWLMYELPSLFGYNTFIALLSSLFMHLSYRAAGKDELGKLKPLLGITLLLGILFMVMQYMAWGQMIDNNVHLVGNPSESFVYVISAVHLVHMLIGVGFVTVVLIKAINFNVHKKNMLTINLCATYWHFVGFMWIYLYLFFQFNR